MGISDILSRIEKETQTQLETNKLKINRFFRKYNNARKCFYDEDTDENDDLYDFLFDISKEYRISEADVYFAFVESKYTIEGELATSPEEYFAAIITVYETIKKSNDE
jgi:hypothetical protein